MSFLAKIGLAALLTTVAVSTQAQDGKGEGTKGRALPVELVRTLQALQDQIAGGSTSAHLAQRALLSHIDERIMPLGPEVWSESKNIRAAIVYALSGGRPEILKRILTVGRVEGTDLALLQGALSYVEGREAEAQKFLADIDVRTLPVSLSGQIALVQAALNVREDPAKSITLLDFARLQLPGTLIEEAALRREIFVVSQTGDTKKFDALSRQYLRRFRFSVYSGNFRQRFAAALTRLEFTRDPNYFSRLVAVVSELEPAGQLELYLLVARAAINQGQTHAAVQASDRALTLSGQDNVSFARARLYRAAATIVTLQSFDESVAELKNVDRSLLAAADQALLDSALAMATNIRRNPSDGAVEISASNKQSTGAPAASAIQRPTVTISRAQEILGAVDQLVRKDAR